MMYFLIKFIGIPFSIFWVFIGISILKEATKNEWVGLLIAAVSCYACLYCFRYGKADTKKLDSFLNDPEILSIKNGNLPIAYTRNARLRKDEIPHFAESAQLMEVKTAGYKSNGANIRFRVAKGVTIGTSKGRMRADKQLMSVSEGELIITNMRVIFAGNMKSFEYSVDKIINYEKLDDGVVLNTSSKSHILQMNNKNAILFDLIMKQV